MECVICLDNISDNDSTAIVCGGCNNKFHNECLGSWKNNQCPLCRKPLYARVSNKSKRKYTFNNMNERDKYDIEKILSKWEKEKKCIKQDHPLVIETLGDWSSSNNRTDEEPLTFRYTCMLVECRICNKNCIIK